VHIYSDNLSKVTFFIMIATEDVQMDQNLKVVSFVQSQYCLVYE
jgi:hypothetical protein